MTTKVAFFLAALLWSLTVKADTLTTASFVVDISRHCEAGNVTCDQVSDVGVSKKSGNRIALKGKSLHAMCADGVTPCRFLGYRFRNESTDPRGEACSRSRPGNPPGPGCPPMMSQVWCGSAVPHG